MIMLWSVGWTSGNQTSNLGHIQAMPHKLDYMHRTVVLDGGFFYRVSLALCLPTVQV